MTAKAIVDTQAQSLGHDNGNLIGRIPAIPSVKALANERLLAMQRQLLLILPLLQCVALGRACKMAVLRPPFALARAVFTSSS